jgi:hypothetical protein
MRPLIAVGFLAALSCLPACGGENRSVTAPSPTAPAASPVPPNPRPGPSTAVLAVSTFTAVLVPPALTRTSFGYDVKLELSETSGRSGATLTKITLIFPSGDTDNTGPGCWGKPVRINPGSTWDMARASLGYCALEPGSNNEVSSLALSVTFIDDDGRSGSVQGNAIVTKP